MHPVNTAITAAMLGTGSAATRETLINYIRGGSTADPNCTDGNPATACTTWATWPHFDVQHSRPTVVTYDGSQNPPIQYVFYVQDNGMLTAVDANTGQEKWSFLIEEAIPQLSALQASVNGPEIYVADGSPAVFYDDQNGDGIINGSDRVWLFFGLRRGGRVMYALDITSKDQPLFKWKITANSGTGMVCLGNASCSPNAQFSELGQTWSTPQIGPIRNLGVATGYIPALIFAGGYDPLEDALPWVGSSGSDTMGRAVYVLRADNTQVINSWGVGQGGSYRTSAHITTFSIPSDVVALNTDNDAQGFLDRIYVGDLGGNVWRFDIDDSNQSNWRGEQLASLSDSTGEKRKFFFPPAVAPQNSPFRFDAVYIGSGDKEHPSCSTAGVNGCAVAVATDRIFMLMDDPSLDSGGGTPSTSGFSAIATPITLSSLVQLSDTDTCGVGGSGSTCSGQSATILVGKQGWDRKLDVGEKVTNSPTVFFNNLSFGTYAPSAQTNSCTPPGQGRLNQIGALLGDLQPLNGGSVASASDRYYSNFLTRGYISTGQLVVVGNVVYKIVVSDAQLQYTKVATIGGATKIYWYMEPEQ
jgi:type IV pilus assembly protein PilY1